ncbi:permease-like cell division protein FtsX [Actinophytocola sp.]|uniref:permease-like cell division protein FtsX n=1 Tax=Actinophytocola sp. TaxID=1872138 RepID=UPI002ED1AEF5
MTRQIKLVLWTAVGLVIAAVATVTLLVVADYDGRSRATTPVFTSTPVTPECVDTVTIYFPTDEEMTEAAKTLREDREVGLVRTETQAEAYERFLEIFEDDPELADIASPDSLPATTDIRIAVGVDLANFADRLRKDYEDVSIIPCRLI